VTAVLVIAGTDSSGGAGLTRDTQVLTARGCRVLCAVTAVTAQSDAGMSAALQMSAHLVRAQIAAAFATRRIDAIKIGMLGDAATVRAVCDGIPPRAIVPLVLDPVLASTSGAALLDAPGQAALIAELLPRTTVLTPNLPEAAQLLGTAAARDAVEAERQARALLALGAQAVLLKGGHATGALACDLLVSHGAAARSFSAARLPGAHRGSGCALAAALAAELAFGHSVIEACERAKHQVTELLRRET
jgi:hydroxymethylpyrimidine/phosphomethylpyrimidine kinase